MSLEFYKCSTCGNIAVKAVDSGVPLMCCGTLMETLSPNTTDAATEKHVPAVSVDGPKVSVVVGEVEHPMTQEHSIQFICLETKKGYQIAQLTPSDAPKAEFCFAEGDAAVAVYEYCNLHGLWVATI